MEDSTLLLVGSWGALRNFETGPGEYSNPLRARFCSRRCVGRKATGLSPNHKTMEYKRLIRLRSRIIIDTKNQVRAIKKDIANKSKSIESQHKALHSYLSGTRGVSINAAVSDYLNDATVQNSDFILMWFTMKLRNNGLLITETIVQRANCKSLQN